MRKFNSLKFFVLAMFVMLAAGVYAQEVTVSGIVVDTDTKEPAPFANVVISGTQIGVATDLNGRFTLTTSNQKLPFTLDVIYTGYETASVEITENNQNVQIELKTDAVIIGEGVVVSASRQPERILESPVSIERMDARMIKSTASASFYDALENLKGVQLNTNSLTFKSINTRGFATFANVRFVQAIDGMDNAAPGLNFPAGNLVGISELDLQNAELVPGAASALYGPNAFNGILFLTSKDPYLNQGLSAQVKGGITTQDDAFINESGDETRSGTNPFGSFAIRYARAFGKDDRIAAKINFSYLKGTDWFATDYRDMDSNPLNAAMRGVGSPSYDGVNIYGDEIATTIDVDAVVEGIVGVPLGLDPIRVARTGYREVDLVEYNAESIKADFSLHYKLTETMQILGNYRYGSGATVYQGANRYSLNDITLQQARVELKDNNFNVKWYTTIEDAGGSWDTRFAAWNINRSWKDDTTWFTQYTENYIGTLLAACPGGVTDDCVAAAHANGRAAADAGRLLPGTPEFEAERDRISELADLTNGSRFIDKTRLNHVEVNYNFMNQIEFMELLVGANWRKYRLNSEGTIFTDADGPIPINEYGGYVQVAKQLLPNDILKLTGSLRFDKNENFEGRFTPRASAVLSLGSNREHNIRASFQTGFRNPDTQSQFIGLDLGVATLVGGTEQNINDYSLEVPYIDAMGNFTTATVLGPEIYSNSYTASSATVFAGTGNPADLVVADVDFIKPEKITSYEIGYRGVIAKKLLIDWNFYYSKYKDFQANTNVVNVLTGDVTDPLGSGIQDLAFGRTRVFQLYSNATGSVSSYGIGFNVNYALPQNFIVGGNYSFAELDIDESADPDLIPGFNTPKHRFNLNFGNTNIANSNVSFMINFRWLDDYRWEASFGNGDINGYNVLDAQISYDIKKIDTSIKLGASNILNESYFQAFGSAPVGGQYFIAITYTGRN